MGVAVEAEVADYVTCLRSGQEFESFSIREAVRVKVVVQREYLPKARVFRSYEQRCVRIVTWLVSKPLHENAGSQMAA